jgi:hypothetical protein
VLAAGGSAYIAKPIDTRELPKKLLELAKKQSP